MTTPNAKQLKYWNGLSTTHGQPNQGAAKWLFVLRQRPSDSHRAYVKIYLNKLRKYIFLNKKNKTNKEYTQLKLGNL